MDQTATGPCIENRRQTLDRLLALEALTTDLLTCPEEQLPDRLARRQALMDEITALADAYAKAVRPAAPQDPDAPAPETDPAPQDETPREEFPQTPEGDALRELTGQCRAVACRMQELDAQAIGRMKNIQQKILQKIRSVEKSTVAHAARYYTPAPRSSLFTGSI